MTTTLGLWGCWSQNAALVSPPKLVMVTTESLLPRQGHRMLYPFILLALDGVLQNDLMRFDQFSLCLLRNQRTQMDNSDEFH